MTTRPEPPPSQGNKLPRATGKAPVAPGPGTPSEPGLPLPHERDESRDSAGHEPRKHMDQARKDLEAGQVDTDMRVTPGLDAERRDNIVSKGNQSEPSTDGGVGTR